MLPDNSKGYPKNVFIRNKKIQYTRANQTLFKGNENSFFEDLNFEASPLEFSTLDSKDRIDLTKTLNFICRPRF